MLLESQFGIPRQHQYRLLQSGRKRIRMVSAGVYNLLSKLTAAGPVGLYIGEYSPQTIRLSMDGAHLLGPLATKQTIELDDDQAKTWLQGEPMNYKAEHKGYVIVVNQGDILGCGRLSDGVLHSFVPKVRRLK
jgi:NOL1/NOP2/fmu family ribosome biogenesis protein